ncbi:MAG TPA: helicase-related protein, partial [Planctomycetota bacterium]|nr:helicase-related protein [Planctomycetota bacterium]
MSGPATEDVFRFQVSDLVQLRGGGPGGLVRRRRRRGDVIEYEIFFDATRTTWHAEAELQLEGEADDLPSLIAKGEFADAAGFRARLTLAKLLHPLADHLYAKLSNRIDYHPYQFVPLLKFLSTPADGLLIADEVGLGKTIEAGLIYTELKSRGQGTRLLIVLQGYLLQQKWRLDLQRLFDEEFEIFDGERMRSWLERASRDPALPLKAIVSLPLLRRPENLEALHRSRAQLDLVIVDEAHRLRNPETESHALGEELQSKATHLLLLTATPLQTSRADLYHLLSLVYPEAFDDEAGFQSAIEPNRHLFEARRLARSSSAKALTEWRRLLETRQSERFLKDPAYLEGERLLCDAGDRSLRVEEAVRFDRLALQLDALSSVLTRTTKRQVHESFAERRARRVPVILRADEQALLERVRRLASLVYTASGTRAAGFGAMMLERQASSCLPAIDVPIANLVSRHHLGSSEEEIGIAADDLEIDIEEGRRALTAEVDAGPAAEAAAIIAEARRMRGHDTKYARFRETVIELIESFEQPAGVSEADRISKILVFSFFRPTLVYLQEQIQVDLAGRAEVHVIHGEVDYEERLDRVNAFRTRSHPFQILLSSEVGGEGIDLIECSCVFNYDMPWNPMVVEQRIGRVDRIGQKSQIVDVRNMAVQGTIDERIFLRLFERIRVFEESIGDLEEIIGDELRALQRDLFHRRLDPADEERHMRAIEEAVLRRRQLNTDILEQKDVFVGFDDFFDQEVKTRPTVEGAELLHLIGWYGKERKLPLHVGAVRRTGEVQSAHITGSPAVYSALRPQLQDASMRLLSRVQSGDSFEVVIDRAAARARPAAEFIVPKHPLVRAIIENLRREPAEPRPGLLAVEAEGVERGLYAFFVWWLKFEGWRDEVRTIVPVARLTDAVLDERLSA